MVWYMRIRILFCSFYDMGINETEEHLEISPIMAELC